MNSNHSNIKEEQHFIGFKDDYLGCKKFLRIGKKGKFGIQEAITFDQNVVPS